MPPKRRRSSSRQTLSKIKKVQPSRSLAAQPPQPKILTHVWFATDYMVPAKCMSVQYEVQGLLGSGSYGRVYEAHNTNAKYVVKVVPLNVNIPTPDCNPADPKTWDNCVPVNEQDFLQEAKVAKLMGELNIGPKVYNSWVCDDVTAPVLREFAHNKTIKVGIIVADKMDITVAAYRQQYPESYRQHRQRLYQLEDELLRKFFSTGYVDSDFHDENLMLNLNPTDFSIKEVKIVDFGECRIDRRFGSDKKQEVIQNTLTNL